MILQFIQWFCLALQTLLKNGICFPCIATHLILICPRDIESSQRDSNTLSMQVTVQI